MARDHFFHLHLHGQNSALDAMAPVATMVEKVAKMGQEGMALTDHGNMAGAVQLYKACMKEGVLPFPGSELYVVNDVNNKDAKRFHLTVGALDFEGYKALVALSTKSHTRPNFHKKPRTSLADLHELSVRAADHVYVTTGCYFGLVQQPLVEKGEKAALAMLKTLAKWFPNTLFVEVQHHNIDHADSDWTDGDLVDALAGMAYDVGLPIVATQDCHYLDMKDKPSHTMMKRMVINGIDADDAGFPGDSFHVASAKWVRKHYERDDLSHVWEDAQSSYEWLIDNNRMSMPALDNYKFSVPVLVKKNPDKVLKEKVEKAFVATDIMDMSPNSDKYIERMDYELDVIRQMGMSNYFLIVQDYVQWCKDEDILVMARGSANGSLVCYLLGITQVDPIEWDVPFHRFLSLDRQKPPDIDLDVESDERWRVIEYIRQRFPDLTQIGTFGKWGVDEETGRGSLFVSYLAKARRDLGDQFNYVFGDVKGMPDLRRIAPDDADALEALGNYEIFKGYGAHAAGFVTSGGKIKIEDYVPLMLIASSDTHVTQFDGDDIEDLGFTKLDLLGLRTLTTVKRCLQYIGRRPGDGTDWIPNDDKDTMAFLRKGRMETGIFQFEGYSTAKGQRKQKPKTTRDCILSLALFRPANMFSDVPGEEANTDAFLRLRARDAYYPNEVFKRHLKLTKGIPLFQDQVQDILRDLGMTFDELNSMLKAIKASNENIGAAGEVFESMRERFFELCEDLNMSDEDVEHAWATVAGFKNYGFNRAHATGYGVFGYRMAYLKVHYPLEYHAALLEAWAGTPKERAYQQESRRCGVKLMSADVNVSGANWTLDVKRKGVRRGLTSIKGVGQKAAEEIEQNRPYGNVNELIEKTTARIVTGGKTYPKTENPRDLNGVLGILRDAGALRSLGVHPE